MSKRRFIVLYVASLLVPICIYLASIGWNLDLYALSVALGVCAFVLVCDQLILASRPSFAVQALGQKGIAGLHAAIPALIIILALAHRVLKASAGFDVESSKAELGATALVLMILLSVLAFLLIANIGGPLGQRLKAWRSGLAKRPGVTYKASRLVHGLVALAVPVLMLHFLLASSSDFSRNPLGAAWLAAYALLSLSLFTKYRVSGRKPGKGKE